MASPRSMRTTAGSRSRRRSSCLRRFRPSAGTGAPTRGPSRACSRRSRRRKARPMRSSSPPASSCWSSARGRRSHSMRRTEGTRSRGSPGPSSDSLSRSGRRLTPRTTITWPRSSSARPWSSTSSMSWAWPVSSSGGSPARPNSSASGPARSTRAGSTTTSTGSWAAWPCCGPSPPASSDPDMSAPAFDPLLISVAAPLAVALAIALGLPKRWAVKLAYAGFAVPALMALGVWWQFGSAAKETHGYAFLSRYSTGLDQFGIGLKLGLNGISLPLFVLAGLVGFAAGLYAIQSKAERMKTYLLLLLAMHAGLMGTFASVDVFFFYFFHEMALIPTFIMVGIWGGRDRTYAAMMMTIYLTLGATLSLVGLIAIYAKSGASSFDLMVLRDTLASRPLGEVTQEHIFGLLLFGFGMCSATRWHRDRWARSRRNTSSGFFSSDSGFSSPSGPSIRGRLSATAPRRARRRCSTRAY